MFYRRIEYMYSFGWRPRDLIHTHPNSYYEPLARDSFIFSKYLLIVLVNLLFVVLLPLLYVCVFVCGTKLYVNKSWKRSKINTIGRSYKTRVFQKHYDSQCTWVTSAITVVVVFFVWHLHCLITKCCYCVNVLFSFP